VSTKHPHPYQLRTSTGVIGDEGFRWQIHDDGGLIAESRVSFSASEEAEAAGHAEMQSVIAMWNKP